jgi:hypothetical protein
VEQLESRALLDTGLAAGLTNYDATQLLTSLYNELLDRAPQPSELTGWQSAVNAGRSLQELAQAFLASPEYQTDFITDTYTTLLKRQPQPQEVNGWLQATQAGLSEESLTAQFLASNEYYQDHGSTQGGWLTGLYWDLFQRTPDPTGFYFWRDQLQSGMTRQTLALDFVTGPEADARFVTASYQQFLGRAPDAAGGAAWVAALVGGLSRTRMIAGIIGSPEYALTHSSGSSNLPSNPSNIVPTPPSGTASSADSPGGSGSYGAPPVVSAGADISTPEGSAIQFAGTVTGGTAPYSYAWDFGDGDTASGSPTPSYTYANSGSYTATLTVTDAQNQVGQSTLHVTIQDVAPSVSIRGAPNSSTVGTPVFLTSEITSPSLTEMAAGFSYNWNVTKDGAAFAAATTPNFNFMPMDPGSYVVSLAATAQDNNTGSASQAITVNDVAPLVSIEGAPPSSAPGTAIALTSSVFSPSPAETAAGFRYAWSITSNSTVVASGSNPNITFTPAAAGTYVAVLTAVGGTGMAGTASQTLLVTTPNLTTPYDQIPNFGANPTLVSVASGAWSSPSTWSLGRVPQAGDVVSINPSTSVSYDSVSSAAVQTVVIQAGGSLVFRTDMSTTLTVVNLLVLQGGTLQIGTTSNPVAAGVTAQVVFANQPLNTTLDPAQYGDGLIALGTVTMYGAAKTQTFVKLATAPKAGDGTLTLSQPVTGWQVGDRLLLPDSRQLVRGNQTDSNYVAEEETPTIAGISSDGLTLTLSSPLQYDHPGAADAEGMMTFLPYVGNLSRNIMIRSQDATGTRGHVLFSSHAIVDVEYAGFYGLGRTRETALDNTTFDAKGNVTHVGTNEDGRYPVYFDHVIGSGPVQSDGYLYTMEGDVVFCPLEPMPYRWGVAINDSSFGLIQDNVVDNWEGAGIITVSGNESENVINHNFVVDIQGPEGEAQLTWLRADSGGAMGMGYEGVGFWFRGFNNYVTNNVAADCGSYGFTYFAQYLGSVNIPLAPGDDTSTAGQYQTVNMNAMPILQFSGDECFGATCSGMTIWWLATIYHTPQNQTPTSLIKDFHVWNVDNQGFFAYEMNKVTFDGFVVLDSFSLLAQGEANASLQGFGANDYFLKDLLIENSSIEGMWIGFEPSTDSGGGIQTIQTTYLDDYYNVYEQHLWTSAYRSDQIPPRVTHVRDCTFATPNVPEASTVPEENFFLDGFLGSDMFNLIQLDQLFVYDYNGVAGDDFQVYFMDQNPTFIVPRSTYNSDGTPRLDASPLAGLTNQQLRALDGAAIAGAIAPATTAMAGVHGYVQAF